MGVLTGYSIDRLYKPAVVHTAQFSVSLHSGFSKPSMGNVYSVNGVLLLLHILGRSDSQELHTAYRLGLLRCGNLCSVS